MVACLTECSSERRLEDERATWANTMIERRAPGKGSILDGVGDDGRRWRRRRMTMRSSSGRRRGNQDDEPVIGSGSDTPRRRSILGHDVLSARPTIPRKGERRRRRGGGTAPRMQLTGCVTAQRPTGLVPAKDVDLGLAVLVRLDSTRGDDGEGVDDRALLVRSD